MIRDVDAILQDSDVASEVTLDSSSDLGRLLKQNCNLGTDCEINFSCFQMIDLRPRRKDY